MACQQEWASVIGHPTLYQLYCKRSMQISRHARNNMRLYEIQQEDIETAIQAPDKVEAEGHYRAAYKAFPDRFRDKPLKVVYLAEGDEVIVVTAYPVRKRQWR